MTSSSAFVRSFQFTNAPSMLLISGWSQGLRTSSIEIAERRSAASAADSKFSAMRLGGSCTWTIEVDEEETWLIVSFVCIEAGGAVIASSVRCELAGVKEMITVEPGTRHPTRPKQYLMIDDQVSKFKRCRDDVSRSEIKMQYNMDLPSIYHPVILRALV
jgi:hypothetical protein